MSLHHRAVLGRVALLSVVPAIALLGAVTVSYSADPAERYRPLYRRPSSVPFPVGNEYTDARGDLGKALFFDPRLSGAKDISCATCHAPTRSWGDGRPLAVGTGGQILARRTPTVLNTAWATALFWDGRAETLEEQATGPIQAPAEMRLPLDSLVKRLEESVGYREMFVRAYDAPPSADLVAKAIATFERTIVSASAPFDKWVAGDDRAMSDEAKRGFVIFNTKGKCAQCHSGWRLTDDSFHDIGTASADSGRARVIPGIQSMEFAFKTPTLRNVVERAPYMHDGSEATLEDVIDLYDRGGRVRRASISSDITPLGLSAAERRDLLAFLRAVSSRDPLVTAPELPR
jgi:cytochrome c peroxidase